MSVLFYIFFALYEEILVRIYDQEDFFANGYIFIILSSLILGIVIYIITAIFKNKKISRWLCSLIMFVFVVYTCIQHCCKSFYMSYFSIATMTSMAGQVVGDFRDLLFQVIGDNILFILLSLIPIVLFIVFRKKLVKEDEKKHTVYILILLVLAVASQFGVSYFGNLEENVALYTYGFEVNDSLPSLGLATSIRLELEYMITGKPKAPEIIFEPIETNPEDELQVTTTPAIVIENTTGSAVEEGTESDAGGEKDDTQSRIDEAIRYFYSLTPTNKNQYSGVFEGKNLIMICAEAFSPYWVDEEKTPALYRLMHECFYFTNYYQPLWGQSTSGGEYSFLLGNIPTHVVWEEDGQDRLAMSGSSNRYWPYSMAAKLNKLGYHSIAWHDNPSTVYDRNLSHPNIGYEFYGIDNGLDLTSPGWKSDLEMFQLTVPEYLDDYVNNGQKFNVYYMSVSGHAQYTWKHAMAAKNKELIQELYPDLPEETQAYIAASYELEKALEYLLEELEKAGALEDTVICLTADHYPYVLLRHDAYTQISGYEDTEGPTDTYRNALILWCGDGTGGGQTVDTPCTAIDILPTLLNMFGIDYDSRLITGRDIFATNYTPYEFSTNMPLAIIPTSTGRSWRTDAGVYETKTKTFYPNEGVTVADDYVQNVINLVNAKYQYAAEILNLDLYKVLGIDMETE